MTNSIHLDGGLFSSPNLRDAAVHYATAKVLDHTWSEIFLRGILANWLVCIAVFLNLSSRETVSKIIAIWWPTMCFCAIGADHVIANMFYIPLGIWLGGTKKLDVGTYIWKSMVPAGLGNVVGGGLFVGVLYWYIHLTGDENDQNLDSGDVESGSGDGFTTTGVDAKAGTYTLRERHFPT
jgi:formate/nitrite transporter